ncbi:MAG TPA: NAD-binding protein [Ktedonobacterales bacterium]
MANDSAKSAVHLEDLEAERTPAADVRQRYSAWRLLRANLHDLRILLRESYVGLIALALLMAMDTVYLTRSTAQDGANALAPWAALYESLKLLIFQSGLSLPSDLLGAALFFLTPLLGLGLLVQTASSFGRRLLDKSSRRETWQVALASTFHEHVIVSGLGRVGLRVARQLIEAGYHVVFIQTEWNEGLVPRALEMNIPVVIGDAREPATLRQAGILRARAVIACINGDLLNIEIALAARKLRPKLPVVLRAFDEELDAGVEHVFGKDSTFSTSALSAPTLAAAMLSRGIDYVLPATQASAQLAVTHLTIPQDSKLVGPLAKFEEQSDVRVLAVANGSNGGSGGESWSTTGKLKGGSRVDVVGTLPALERLRQQYEARTAPIEQRTVLAESLRAAIRNAPEANGTVIVCGMGKVGYRVVKLLLEHELHPRIVVIQLKDDPDSFIHRINDPTVRVIFGDARNPDVLRQAGIEQAFALAALTANDLTNLQIGLAARRECDDVHLVLRVFSDALADKLVEMFGIQTTYSTSGLAAPTLAAAAILNGASYAFAAGMRLFSGVELVAQAGDGLSGRSVGQIRQRQGKLVIALRRGGQVQTLPALDQTVQPGDAITLLAPLQGLAQSH